MFTLEERLLQWFSERPVWLQNAALRLYQQKELTDQDISELATLCKQQATDNLPDDVARLTAFSFTKRVADNLHLCSIGDVKGVNALAPNNTLKFNENNLSIVYGANGSGKSSYVKLLKYISRALDTEIPSLEVRRCFGDEINACIKYKKNSAPCTYMWPDGPDRDILDGIKVYDSSSGKTFIGNDGEVSYELPEISFFTKLIETCTKVKSDATLNPEYAQPIRVSMPSDLKSTDEGAWYARIHSKTSSIEVEEKCTFSEVDDVELQELQISLNEKSPARRALEVRNQKKHTDNLIIDAQKYFEQLSDKNCDKIIVVKNKMIQLKKIAETIDKNDIFKNETEDSLDGVGTNVWKELWEAARNYSNFDAYREHKFPYVNDNAKCVLCQQQLTPVARNRLLSFENFVKSNIQMNADRSTKEYEAAILAIDVLPSSDTLTTKFDAADNSGVLFRQADGFFEKLQTRLERLKGNDFESIADAPLPSIKWIGAAANYSKSLEEQANIYENMAEIDNLKELQYKLKSLKAKKWLSEQKITINENITRMFALDQIQDSKKFLSTTAISSMQRELADELITPDFLRRFKLEFDALSPPHLKVKMQRPRASKGRVLFRIELEGGLSEKIQNILSEGEYRLVSLAAFFADVTGSNNSVPLIFDDPISSLDESFEESVAKRLIKLSQSNQVIVFTHRLAFLRYIRNYLEEEGIEDDMTTIVYGDCGAGEPILTSIYKQDITDALNLLMGKRFNKARDAHDNGDPDLAESIFQSICIDFRILVESSIEKDLLCGVVHRFQRPIRMGRLKHLRKLDPKDCRFLEMLMTKYSWYAHSHPPDSSGKQLNPEDLHNDMMNLKIWRKQFKNRPIPVVGIEESKIFCTTNDVIPKTLSD